MPGSTDVKPAFGQVWEYGGVQMMLLHPDIHHTFPTDDGTWISITLSGTKIVLVWAGLHDTNERRLDGWKLLSEVES